MGVLGSGLTGLGNVATAGQPPGGSGGSAGNVWLQSRIAAISRLYPAVMAGLNFVYSKPSNLNQATVAGTPTTSAQDAAIIGGALKPGAAQYLTCTGVIQTDTTTQPYAWFARAKFALPSANYQAIGLSNTNDLAVLTSYTPNNATNLVLEFFNNVLGSGKTVTSFAIDGREHNVGVLFDGITHHVFVDDVEVGSTVVLTTMTVGPRVWSAFNATAGDVHVCDLAYGYQLPGLSAALSFGIKPGQKIVFDGDSVTAGSPDATFRWQAPLEASLNANMTGRAAAIPTYANVGVAADTTTNMLARVAGTIAAAPNHVMVMCGVNDFFNHGGAPIPPATSASNAAAYIAALVAAIPTVRIHWIESLWAASEQRPRGIGPNDASVLNTMNAIKTVAQTTAGCEWLGIASDIWTLYSPGYNPTNLVNGKMTQGDGTHPAKTAGQMAISNAVYNRLTLGF